VRTGTPIYHVAAYLSDERHPETLHYRVGDLGDVTTMSFQGLSDLPDRHTVVMARPPRIVSVMDGV
jgi:hypothetical protein